MLRQVMLLSKAWHRTGTLVGDMTVNAFIKQHSAVSYYVLRFAISWGVVGWPRKRLQRKGSTSVGGFKR